MLQSSDYTECLLKHSGKFLLLGITLCLGSLFGISQLKFSTSYKAFLERENPHLLQLESIERTYNAGNDNIVVLIRISEDSFLDAKWLAFLNDVIGDLDALDHIDRIESILSHQLILGNEEEILIEPAQKALVTNQPTVERGQIVSHIMADELVIGRLLSDDGRVAAIVIELALPDSDHTKAVVMLGDKVNELKRQWQHDHPGVDIYLSGTVLFDYSMLGVLAQDMIGLFPVIIFILLALSYFFFGSLLPLLPVSTVIAMSGLGVAGVAGALKIDINSVSSMAFIVVAILAVADSIHLIANYAIQRNAGSANRAAMLHSLRLNFKPMCITSFTTALGFMSLLFSESPPFHHMGILVAFGVLLALAITITMLPWIIVRLDIGQKGLVSENSAVFFDLTHWIIRNRKSILLVFIPLSLAISAFSAANHINDDSLKWFDTDTDFRQAVDFASSNIGGIRIITYSFDTGKEEGINDIAFLSDINDFRSWLKQQPEVSNVYDITEIYKRMNMAFNNNSPSSKTLPESSELAAQYWLTYQMGAAPAGNSNSLTSDENRHTRMIVSLRNLPNKEYIAFEHRSYQWMQDNMPTYATHGTSVPIMFAMVGQQNLEQMLIGGAGTLALITVILVFAFRSVTLGVGSILPNVLPISVAYGCWGLAYGELNMAASIMFSVGIGIVVDDTIHLVTKYIDACQHNSSIEDALAHALGATGSAIVITSAILACSLMVFLASDFVINSSIGLMLTITVIFAMLFDLICLPVFLYYIHHWLRFPKLTTNVNAIKKNCEVSCNDSNSRNISGSF